MPSISASTVSEGGSMGGINVVLVVVLVLMVVLILLPIAGMVIAFFIGKRFSSSAKPSEGKYIHCTSLSVKILY